MTDTASPLATAARESTKDDVPKSRSLVHEDLSEQIDQEFIDEDDDNTWDSVEGEYHA